jgi:hypothetical protein
MRAVTKSSAEKTFVFLVRVFERGSTSSANSTGAITKPQTAVDKVLKGNAHVVHILG